MRVTVWRRARLADCICWQLKVLLIVALLVVLFVPVLLDNQYFHMEEIPVGLSPIKLNINPNDIQTKFTSQQQSFLAYHERTTLLYKKSLSDSQAKMELEELLKFEPPMSEYERAVALFTLDVFVTACEAANLTFFLISGSALGAVRHHGMIPWDDDIDIVMNSSQWEKIRNVLGNVDGFDLFTPSKVQWKFFMKSLPQGNRPFKFPNVDIFFFNEDETHIWSQTWGAKTSLCSKKSDIFPLARRKFERWNLPVPRLVNMLISAEFGDFDSACKTASYVHKTNVRLSSVSLASIDCHLLHHVFPFVFREINEPGVINEICKVGGKKVGAIKVPIEL